MAFKWVTDFFSFGFTSYALSSKMLMKYLHWIFSLTGYVLRSVRRAIPDLCSLGGWCCWGIYVARLRFLALPFLWTFPTRMCVSVCHRYAALFEKNKRKWKPNNAKAKNNVSLLLSRVLSNMCVCVSSSSIRIFQFLDVHMCVRVPSMSDMK